MDNYCELCECYIREATIFSDLTEEQLAQIKRVVKVFSFKKKAFIFLEGDPCRGLFVVKRGRVKLLRIARDGKEQIINIVDTGGILGMEIFYNSQNYSSTAIAMEDTDLCFVSKESFEDILKRYPAIGRKMITALSKELEDAYERIGTLGLMSAKQRLASLIYALARENDCKDDEEEVRLKLPFSRLEIAEILGITQETSIRLLKALKDEGFIEIKGKKEIYIHSVSKLRELAEV